jgi:hypothetical protein
MAAFLLQSLTFAPIWRNTVVELLLMRVSPRAKASGWAQVKGETLMEHETVRKEVSGTKRTLTLLAGSSALIGVIAAIVRSVAGSQIHDYTHPLIGLLGIGMILSLFVALLALNTRLQVAFDETAYEPATDNE